MQHKHNTL